MPSKITQSKENVSAFLYSVILMIFFENEFSNNISKKIKHWIFAADLKRKKQNEFIFLLSVLSEYECYDKMLREQVKW